MGKLNFKEIIVLFFIGAIIILITSPELYVDIVQFTSNQYDSIDNLYITNYHKNYRSEVNLTEAIRCLKLTVEHGDATAQADLGKCYEDGIGVEKDLTEAAMLYKLAADQGLADGQYNLGRCYSTGKGITKISEARHYYEFTTSQTYTARNIPGISLEKASGVEENLKQAAFLFKRAADQGHAKAQYKLGLCYEKGEGVKKNLTKAIQYYTLAADQGNTKAQQNLALCSGKKSSKIYSNYKLPKGHKDYKEFEGWRIKINRYVPSSFWYH